MFEIHIDLQPVLIQAERELKSATDKEIEDVMKDLAESAPDELRNMLGYGDRSKKGEPPTNDTFELYASIRAEKDDKGVTVYFAEHAKYLDPVFGGYLDRPFIATGIENAVRKLESL